MECRIGIVGSAGTGKSGLGRMIAARLDVPFLAAKDITRQILENEKYDWGSGVYVERFLARKECQDQILRGTVAQQEKHESFVTDRTSIDLAAYAIAELRDETEKVNEIVAVCRGYAETYTHLLLCPWGVVPLEGNGIRTIDPWYQFTIHSLMLGVLDEWGIPHGVVRGRGEERLSEAMQILGL